MKTEVLAPTAANLARCAAALRAGELVAIPTETVYGLAANALDATAVAKIFAAKERPTFDPLIVHVAAPPTRAARDLRVLLEESGLVDARGLAAKARERAARLATSFWPGPLTLVLPRGPRVPDLVTSGLDTVAIRMPRHRVAQALLRSVALPLAAPSANRFGRISPTSAADVVAELAGRVALVLDGGACEVGVESTVVRVNADASLSLLRPGGVPVEAIARVAGEVPESARGVLEAKAAASPGMLASHYAPVKPVVLLDGPLSTLRSLPADLPARGKIGLLALSASSHSLRRFRELAGGPAAEAVSLSSGGDLSEAARHLFARLRWLDNRPGVECILAEQPEEGGGLAHAIRDRLQKAAHAHRSS